MKLNYQNYLHYKLPITIKPLEFGKLIEQIGNKFIIQLNTTNIVVISQKENENYIKFFRKGELMFEFKDVKKSEISFMRIIGDQRYTFEKNKLISTEILSSVDSVFIYPLYEDTNSILVTPSYKIIDHLKIYKSFILKNYKAELFILFELFLIFSLYIICFVIFPETSDNTALAAFSHKNIIKLRKTKSINS
jgi:hypothetical protein